MSEPTGALSMATTCRLMAGLFVRHTVLRTRSLLALALVAIDVLVAFTMRNEVDDVNVAFATLTNEMMLGFVLPFAALMYGVAVVRDEAEGGTLPYLFVRPLPRAGIFLGRLLGAAGVVVAITAGCTLLHLLILGIAPAGAALRIVAVCALGALTYAAVFAAIGAFFNRPFVVGVLALIIVDLPVSQLPLVARYLTVRGNLENLAGLRGAAEGLAKLIDSQIAVGSSLLIVLGLLGVALATGIAAFDRRESTGETPA